jgi:hypothetical protein
MTFGLRLIASVGAIGLAVPAPRVKANIAPTAKATDKHPDSAAASSPKAPITLRPLEAISDRRMGTKRIRRLAARLPDQTTTS